MEFNENFLKLNDQEIEKLEQDIKSAIDSSKKNGQLDLLLSPNTEKIAALYIIKNKKFATVYFTNVVPRKDVYVEEAKDQRLPEIYTESELLTTDIVAKNLRTFLHDYYYDLENLPITIYSSKKDFLEKKPLAEIETFSDNIKAA